MSDADGDLRDGTTPAGEGSDRRDGTTGPVAQNAPDDAEDVTLRARLDLLRVENERLRREYVRARRASYRRASVGLAVVGLVAVLGGALFPAYAETLFVLGAIGIFGAVLTRYLTPERFVAAETGERIYAALARTAEDLVGQLGLQETRVYVPIAGTPPARLFVPQRADYRIPDAEALDRPLVVGIDDAERGASFAPTGGALFREFERRLTGSLAESPVAVTEQVGEALVEGFELADSAETDVDADAGRASLVVQGSAYGGADRFDNPLGSLLAVALARSLDTPVELELTATGDDGLTATCRWDTGEPEPDV